MKNNIMYLVYALVIFVPGLAFGDAGGNHDLVGIGAGLGIGLAAMGGALGQGKAISSTLDAIGRNPGAAGKMGLWFFVGLALVESLVILAFVIANKLSSVLAA